MTKTLNQNALETMYDALKVMMLTTQTSNVLKAVDPMAWEQARQALQLAEADLVPRGKNPYALLGDVEAATDAIDELLDDLAINGLRGFSLNGRKYDSVQAALGNILRVVEVMFPNSGADDTTSREAVWDEFERLTS